MKRFLTIKMLVLALTVLVGSIAVVASERAFSAHETGVAAFITDENGNVVGAEVTGSGHATHLGQFTNIGKVKFTPNPDNPNIVHPSGEAVLIAADGDKLSLVIENASMDLTTGIASGQFRFTGGTGRFANATGITEGVVVQNLLTGGFELTMVGKIDY